MNARPLRQSHITPNSAQDELDRFFLLSLDMLCIAGFDGYFKRLNPAWERTLGFTTQELLARPYLDFVHPDDRQATTAEADHLSVDGIDVISFKNRYRCRDGSYKWLLWNSTPFPDQELIFAVARDVTESERLEEALRQQAGQLARSNRELEDFTYVVSHDLKEPLRGIEAFSSFLVEDYGEQLDEQGRRYVAIVRESAVRMKGLIEDLLQLSRIGRTDNAQAPASTRDLLEDVREILRFTLNDRNVELHIQDELPTLVCD